MTSSHSDAQTADPNVRRRDIRFMFEAVAPRYDLLNDLMSFGIHRLWKRRVARMAAARSDGLAVDLAGGTGDIAALLRRHKHTVVVCDPSEGMMTVGRRHRGGLDWVAGYGESLPFADDTVDLVTIGFGLRNVSERDKALAEIHRVLRPGGLFICLEFSRPARWLAPFYDFYSATVIPWLGALVSGNRNAYRYLVDSIRAFPDQSALKRRMEKAGFERVSYRNLSFGIAALHVGTKPV